MECDGPRLWPGIGNEFMIDAVVSMLRLAFFILLVFYMPNASLLFSCSFLVADFYFVLPQYLLHVS